MHEANAHPDPASAPKPIPQAYPFDFEASLPALSYSSTLPDLSYGSTSLEGGSGQSSESFFTNLKTRPTGIAHTNIPYPDRFCKDDALQSHQSCETQLQNFAFDGWPKLNAEIPSITTRQSREAQLEDFAFDDWLELNADVPFTTHQEELASSLADCDNVFEGILALLFLVMRIF